MDAQESVSPTKPKLGQKVTQVATLYNPRTWKEKGLWWTLGLFLVTYVIVFIVLGFIWSRSPANSTCASTRRKRPNKSSENWCQAT